MLFVVTRELGGLQRCARVVVSSLLWPSQMKQSAHTPNTARPALPTPRPRTSTTALAPCPQGDNGCSEEVLLDNGSESNFQRGAEDRFPLRALDVGGNRTLTLRLVGARPRAPCSAKVDCMHGGQRAGAPCQCGGSSDGERTLRTDK